MLTPDEAVLVAAELLDDLDAQRRREQDAYRLGYRDGFASGEVVGAGRAEREITQQWQSIADHVHDIAGQPSRAELADRRAAPGGDAYYAAVLRHGGTEFAGVGKPRVPVPADVLRTAMAWRDAQPRRSAAAA